jgi:plastocyanin
MAFASWGAQAPASASDDDKKQKICGEAEERYQKLFGKPSADEDVVVITMYKYNFCPGEIEAKQGTTVRWVNVDKRTSHSVWLREVGKPESNRLFSEEKVEMTLDMAPGEYTYLCGPHWEKEGMTAKIRIVE